MDAQVEALKQFALANYEEGGHWIFETYEDWEYRNIIIETGGHMESAKKTVRRLWEFMNMRQRECY